MHWIDAKIGIGMRFSDSFEFRNDKMACRSNINYGRAFIRHTRGHFDEIDECKHHNDRSMNAKRPNRNYRAKWRYFKGNQNSSVRKWIRVG